MSRSLSIAAVIAAIVVGGCSAQSAPGYVWSYQRDEHEGAKLAYGVPFSDDVLLMMTCAPGSGQVRLSALTERTQEEIVLTSAGARDRFSGEIAPSELGGLLLEAQVKASARSLDGFARTGKLFMSASGETVSLAAGPDERAGVTRFFEVCRV